MKTLYKYIISLSLLAVCSCNDSFLEKYPEDKINDQTFWKTPADLRLYANRFYENLMGITNDIFSSDNQSDNQGPNTRNNYIWNQYVVPTTAGENDWGKEAWQGVRWCNYFLQRYHRVEGDEDEINVYLGEVLFAKSIYYFDKVKDFGDVPWLITDLTTESEELYAPRDKRTVVIDSINACLDKAIRYLPETSEEGRWTKYAALTFKSRVNLYEGTYHKYHGLTDAEKYLRLAANAAEEVIKSNLFELYSTGDPYNDYRDFFNLKSLAGVKEAVFSVQYLIDTHMHNRSRQVRESNTGMTKDFVESFLCTNGLPIANSPGVYKGDAAFMDEFENRDPRMKQIIYTPDRPLRITSTGLEEYEEAPIFSNLANTGYRIFKYYSQYDEDNEPNRCIIDDCKFRYAEVLLNYAEAKAELGECDQEVLNRSINLLRDRVAMPHLSTTPAADLNPVDYGYTISPLLYEIRRERRIELAVEGFRWHDIVRWKAGKLVEAQKTYLGARDPETDTYKVLYPGYTRVWDNKLYLKPIPAEELQLNPNLLPQNPGW